MPSLELESQILKKTKTGLTYVGGDRTTNMEHLACFSGNPFSVKTIGGLDISRLQDFRLPMLLFQILGAMYGLVGYDVKKSEPQKKWAGNNWIKIGAEITQVCHESYAATPTNLGPDVFQINNRDPEEGLIMSGKDISVNVLVTLKLYFQYSYDHCF